LSIPIKNAGTSRIVIAIEQQHRADATLPERIYESFSRARDRFNYPVTSLAIYTGNTKPVDAYKYKCQGSSLDFRFNVYSVAEAQENLLKIDEQAFATPILTAKLMLMAKGDAKSRGEYSLEIFDLINRKILDPRQRQSFQKFAYRQFQIDEDDIDKKVKEVWNMQFRPISDVLKDKYIFDAKQEGILEGELKGELKGILKGELEANRKVAKKLLAKKMPVSEIASITGLKKSEILALK
jgi:hypothetical protein